MWSRVVPRYNGYLAKSLERERRETTAAATFIAAAAMQSKMAAAAAAADAAAAAATPQPPRRTEGRVDAVALELFRRDRRDEALTAVLSAAGVNNVPARGWHREVVPRPAGTGKSSNKNGAFADICGVWLRGKQVARYSSARV